MCSDLTHCQYQPVQTNILILLTGKTCDVQNEFSATPELHKRSHMRLQSLKLGTIQKDVVTCML